MSHLLKIDRARLALSNADTAWIDRLMKDRAALGLGPLPPDNIAIKYNGQSARTAFTRALPMYKAFLYGARDMGFQLSPASLLLDFGCGWGRFSQVALRDFHLGKIYGVDVSNEALRLCIDAGVPTGLIKLPTSLSPIQLPDASTDLIISNSVFSHLSEIAAKHYISEFHRVLKPGGVAAFTTRPIAMFDYLERIHQRQRSEDIPEHEKMLMKAYPEPEKDRANYLRGEFVYKGNVHLEHYGEAAIPPQWISGFPRQLFAAAEFLPAETSGLEQSVIFCRKG